MSGPFESYDDLEDADERLGAADPGERRVAIIALGHSGDPAAVGHLSGMVADPDAGVRQQVAMALGEFDGPESAAALAKLLVDPEPAVASAAGVYHTSRRTISVASGLVGPSRPRNHALGPLSTTDATCCEPV